MPYARQEDASAYRKKYYEKNKARVLGVNAEWRNANKKKMAEYGVAYAHRHPERRMLSVAKQRAKKKGVEFSISEEDISIPEKCPVFGFPLVSHVGKKGTYGGSPNSPSLDRIDPQKGYVPGNVRVISHLANTMKGASTEDQLVAFAKWVLGQ